MACGPASRAIASDVLERFDEIAGLDVHV